MSNEETWIFGYGSLIWRVDFPYAEARPAFIEGWARRFWQGSTDHRGVPGAPGRVVTLVHSPGERCWGRAYRLDPRSREEVLAQLDHREKGGYERVRLPVHFDDGPAVEGLTYHATEANPNYLGEASLDRIAAQITTARGPSGINTEYVLRLEESLQELGVTDPHVSAVAARIRPEETES